jgi:hypothetical protein
LWLYLYAIKNGSFKESLRSTKMPYPRPNKIIEHITKLDPELAKSFRPKTSATDRFPVRVIRLGILGSASESFDFRVGSFVALSYCWHSAEWGISSSLCEERKEDSIPVSSKMWAMLSLMRESDSEGIWVDQLCIDQMNPTEKHDAIRGMDTIYSSARVVAVALEDIEVSCYELHVWKEVSRRGYEALSKKDKKKFTISASEMATICRCLNKIFSARWVSRSWCFQEYYVCRSCVFLVPCEGDVMVIPSKKVQAALRGRYGFNGYMQWKPFTAAQGFAYKFHPNNSIMEIFALLSSRRATVIGDFPTILLNSSGLSLTYEREATSKDEICYLTVILSLALGDISSLCNDGKQLRLGSNKLIQSWARWPSTMRLPRNSTPLGDPRNVLVLGPEYLQLDLYILRGSLVTPSKASKQKALRFLYSKEGSTLLSLCGKAGKVVEKHAAGLAAALEIGLDGIAQIDKDFVRAKDEGPGVEGVLREVQRLGLSMVDMFGDYFGLENVTEEQRTHYELSFFRHLIRLIGFDLRLDASIILDSTGQRAFCTAGASSTLAVPLIFKESKFLDLKRLWYLDECNGRRRGSWRVVSKGFIYISHDISEKEGSLRLSKVNSCATQVDRVGVILHGYEQSSCKNGT